MKQINLIMNSLGTICEFMVRVQDHKEDNARAVLEFIRYYLLDMDDRLSVFKEKSEISRLNHAGANNAILVSLDTYSILKESKKYYEDTDGNFNVLIGKRTSRWRRDRNHLESSEKYVYEHFDAANLMLNCMDFTASLTSPSMEVDLGGIAKGFVADQVYKILRLGEIDNAIINLGGTILIMGHEETIGLRNPFLPMNRNQCQKSFGSIICKDEVVVTSGIYEQCADKEMLSHHIIDPKTGMPCKTDLISATVVSQNATAADVYATTLIVLGLKEGIEFANDKKISIILVDRSGRIYVSQSLRKRFKFGRK